MADNTKIEWAQASWKGYDLTRLPPPSTVMVDVVACNIFARAVRLVVFQEDRTTTTSALYGIVLLAWESVSTVFAAMADTMFCNTNNHFKVFFSIVRSVAIDVVNYFAGRKWPSYLLFGQYPVFINVTTSKSRRMVRTPNNNITITGNRSTTPPVIVIGPGQFWGFAFSARRGVITLTPAAYRACFIHAFSIAHQGATCKGRMSYVNKDRVGKEPRWYAGGNLESDSGLQPVQYRMHQLLGLSHDTPAGAQPEDATIRRAD